MVIINIIIIATLIVVIVARIELLQSNSRNHLYIPYFGVNIYTLAEMIMDSTLLKNPFCKWKLLIHFDI